jgi:hypothetical protein
MMMLRFMWISVPVKPENRDLPQRRKGRKEKIDNNPGVATRLPARK